MSGIVPDKSDISISIFSHLLTQIYVVGTHWKHLFGSDSNPLKVIQRDASNEQCTKNVEN